ncbi:cell envelope integrity protein TolA [Ruthenibacterium lactatiformans]|uniref:cell envelope integrity protein TolA n=1 Tax=Ruthenibacterium lactatiformans TaxID=1550024 RepID=UPI0022E90F3A|nr:cell envelope integrity protein TolA [Ruthenibacterium lactatiformans]
MNRYLCKCGRAVNKSTNADNTGNRETEGCEGCPYLMPWGPTEWDHTRHAMVTDVKGYECRMSPTLEYRTELRGHLDDKTTIRITSLDFDFLECVSDWVKEHYPNGELSGGFSRDCIRPAEYVDEGRYRYTLACSQNKKGIAAKRALWAEFFDETFHRKDMDADAEKQKILRDIEQGKAAAHKDAAATDKETNTMLIYRDPATGWLYRVSPQPGQDDCFCIEYLDPASSAAWKFWPAEAKTRATSRKTIVEVFEARAKQNGWELVSDTNGCAPGLPEICRGCLCWKCGNVDCDLICDHNDREVHECGNFGSIGMGESCEYYIPKKEEYEPCQNQPAPNGDAAATTAGNAVPEPAETSTTPTDANTLPAPGCPADAGSATQSLSAAGPASLEAEPEATPFDYSGLDAQTVATLHSAENIIRSARKEYVIKVADAVGMAHDELVRNSDGHNQYSEDTFIAWCKFVGISKSTAYQLLQVSNLLESSTPNEQKILKQASPSLLYAAARPSAEPEAVAALKGGDISTHKQYKELEAQLKAEREAREKAEHEAELDRKEREDAHAAALRYKAEADRRAQDQNRLEGLVQTVTHERDGARQALAAAKLRGDKLKEENDALREQPIRGDFADADEIDRRAQEKAEAMTAEYRDQIAELQDRAETGDANACYDQVILASRALENAWTLAKSAYKRLPAGMRAYPREMLHNAFAKFEEELKCL